MGGDAGIEAVFTQFVFALDHLNARQGRGHHHCATHTAIGTVAAADSIKSVDQRHLKYHRAAMALGRQFF